MRLFSSVDSLHDRLSLSQVVSSIGKTILLEILAFKKELNISELLKQAHMNHQSAVVHLAELERLGFVQQKRYGKINIYRYKIENPNARALKNLLLLWKSPELLYEMELEPSSLLLENFLEEKAVKNI
jgi:DNA-binding transcriptional ArsR family regulator